jgi:hypothetical protein
MGNPIVNDEIPYPKELKKKSIRIKDWYAIDKSTN